jgi:hypothetical protein
LAASIVSARCDTVNEKEEQRRAHAASIARQETMGIWRISRLSTWRKLPLSFPWRKIDCGSAVQILFAQYALDDW